MRAPWAVEQPADQRHVPGQARQRRVVIEIDRDRRRRGRLHDGVDIGREPVVRHALVVERRQHQRAGEAELGGMARQRHRVRRRGRAGADHQPVGRDAGVLVGRHHALALLERERRRLAGGAEHIEAVAAVGEQEPRQRGRAREVGLAGLVDRGGDGGDDAGKGGSGHDVSGGVVISGSLKHRCPVGINQRIAVGASRPPAAVRMRSADAFASRTTLSTS